MTQLSVSEHVRESISPHGGSVLLDVRSGHCFAMNPMARTLWQEWCRTGNFDAAVLLLARRHPQLHHDRIRGDARRLADALIDRGLLAARTPGTTRHMARQYLDQDPAAGLTPPTSGPAPVPLPAPVPPAAEVPLAAAQMTMAAAPVRHEGGRTPRAAAATALGLLALLGALLLIRLPLRAVCSTVNRIGRTWCRRDASPEHASASLAAVRRAARLYPGRAACLELSLATLAVLALTGRRAVWCIGTADDPYRFHAWVEAQGVAITSPDDYGIAEFRRVLSV